MLEGLIMPDVGGLGQTLSPRVSLGRRGNRQICHDTPQNVENHKLASEEEIAKAVAPIFRRSRVCPNKRVKDVRKVKNAHQLKRP